MTDGYHGYHGGGRHRHHGYGHQQYNHGYEAGGSNAKYDNTYYTDQDQPYRRGRGNKFRGRGGRRGRQDRKDDREHHPSGLKGREIGLWYAGRSQKKSKETELQNRPFIQMDENKEHNITQLLHTIRSGDAVPQQPRQSYRDPFNSDKETSSRHVKTQDLADHSSADDDTLQIDDVQLSNKPFDFNSDFVSFDSNLVTPGALSMGPVCTVTRACDVSSSAQKTSAVDSWEDIDDRVRDADQDWGIGDNNTHLPSQSGIDSDSDFIKPQWMNAEENSNDDEELPDELMALLRKKDTLEEGDPDAHDAADIQTALYKNEDDDDSSFMAEFHQNKMGNRSCERLNVYEPLQRRPELDKKLLDEKSYRELNDAKYKQMLHFRKKLPSYNMQKEIVRVINENQVTVISGETGCGKTTQITQFILDDYIEKGNGSLCHIACTQPRRISAIAVAERVADERGESCGAESVGYQIRLENKLPRMQGSILYCTTGVMLRWLISNPWLSQTSHVILDEIHERDLHSDFLMIILKDLIQIRPDVKLILMSATLNAQMFSTYFGNCPMLNIPGFTFPVKEYLMEDIIEITKYLHNNPPMPGQRFLRGKKRSEQQAEDNEMHEYIQTLRGRYSPATLDVLRGLDVSDIDLDLVACLISHIHLKKRDGAVLVFLPGWDQISRLNSLLTKSPMFSASSCRIIPLHSLMPTVNQKLVFERPPRGIRKIVLATNIAETSITIDDVVYVIDCGKIKMKNFDEINNVTTLQPEWVSRANARQRRGRAGRVQSGECYHMYTAHQEAKFDDYQLPEILRTRLEELCLQIKLLRLGRIELFIIKAMQTPSMTSIQLAIDNLKSLNALDSQEELTPLGYHLAKMPLDPHTGKMLLFAAMFCCLDPILTIAASLSFKDAFYIPLGQEKLADQRRKKLDKNTNSDHIMLATAYQGWEQAFSRGTSQQYCQYNFLSFNKLQMLKKMRKQFTQLLAEMKFIDTSNPKDPRSNKNSENVKLLKSVICAGLYPNVARTKPGRRNPNSKAPVKLQSNTERNISFHPKSINSQTTEFESPWFAYHLKMKTSQVYLYDCSMVSPYPLLFFGGTIDVRKDHGQDCIVVDDWIVFRATKRIAHLVKELRVELDSLLKHKISHPGVTNWDPQNKEGALMHAILDLITTEEHKSQAR